MPDETTILKFRNLLEKHALTRTMLNLINDTLEQRGLFLKRGTEVVATNIHAPSSIKNRRRKRDLEMLQTKKGNQWCVGMKIHLGTDVNSGLVHMVPVTAANSSDIGKVPHLLRVDNRAVLGDKGYVNDTIERLARKAGLFWGVSLKASKQHPLPGTNKRFNHKMSLIWARVEHVLHVFKRQFGYTKVHYKGITKNATQVFSLVGLTNPLLGQASLGDLIGEVRPLRPEAAARGPKDLEQQR